MKKVLALSLICFMALGAKLALADTRTDALGLTAGQQVDDLDSIWLFPQDASSFGNVVDFRMGNPNGNHSYDWGGIIHQDFSDLGYFGVYYNRPFDTNDGNGIQPNTPLANRAGILNGASSWANMMNPNNSAFFGPGGNGPNTQSNYPYYPAGGGFPYSINNTLGAEVNWRFNANLNETTVADPSNLFDLFWSKDFSDVVLGVHINYAGQTGNDNQGDGDGNNTYTQGTPTLNGSPIDKFTADSSVIGLDLGATLKNIGTNMSLALGLGYSLGSVNYSETGSSNYLTAGTQTVGYNETIKDNNISELRLNALLKDKVSDTMNARIYGNARLDSLGLKDMAQYDSDGDGTFTDVARETYNGSNTYTDTNINLGLACDHSVADGKAKVIAGAGVIFDSRKWSYTAMTNLAGSATTDQVRWGSGSSYNEDTWAVPFNVAIEAPIFGWLTGRVGATSYLYNVVGAKDIYLRLVNAAGTAYQDTATANNTVVLPQNLNLSYGASAKFDNLTMDLQLSPSALLNFAQGFAPGQGLLYGNTNNAAQAGSSPSQLFATIVQMDMRYAF